MYSIFHIAALIGLTLLDAHSSAQAAKKASLEVACDLEYAKLAQNNKRESLEWAWTLRAEGRIEEAEKIEARVGKLLEKDEVVAIKVPQEGTSESYILELKSGLWGIWKPFPRGKNKIHPIHEIVASRLSSLFNLNIVPLTVERTHNGRQGSMQYFFRGLKAGDKVSEVNYSPNSWLFDYLILYSDFVSSRVHNKPGNLLVWSDDRQVLIDNAEAFYDWYGERSPILEAKRAWEGYFGHPQRRMEYDRRNAKGILDPTHGTADMPFELRDYAPDVATMAKLESVSDDQIRTTIGDLLPPKIVERLIARRNYYVTQMKPLVASP